jgi:hypothetical protein
MDIEAIFNIPSGWVIHVWDCRGTLLPADPDEQEELLKMIRRGELVWLEIEYFKIPVRREVQSKFENERLKKKIASWFWKLLGRRGGGINISGLYTVFIDELEELNEIIEKYVHNE